ncbi:hypothetical protein OB2597_13368 [Pseudooceanicola batsensis HTCC2597]|uniref:Caspase family p20 domain-containing protein n=1 Tax=Pseudooceanicola batsensis (strain ATCC BAA-863 / DSM 15984 / KCTC 12145 / HTCC2597) TaxID=252305 RepID=A3TYA2_PSEBH|nr:caspase family protein [Pseudooceanicola batsensis]EAQ03136.1 hypothetical protein OB2597_13368 [Pseudooceanicola batsensis HTCC2597]
MRTVFAIIMLLATLPAAAEERIALVIGNAQYAQVASLDNASNDAGLIAGRLRALDFDVTLLTDATEVDMKRAVAQFGRDLRAGGEDAVGLFYYAGHGVQSFGANYLVPVDASLTVAADLDLVGVEASTVLRQMASARNRTNIVILDACRNNPFDDIPDMDDNGLAEMKAPTGTFLSYATAPGAVALDGVSDNSPFTRALAETILEQDKPIEQVFKDVRVKVIAETGGAQTPWDTSSLTRDFVFLAGERLTPEEAAEERLWVSVQQTRDPIQYMLFLRSYPDGRYHEQARLALNAALADELDAGQEAPEPTSQAAPAPQPDVATPAGSEAEMMEIARASGAIADYQAYLDAYPEGVFAELVKIEIAAIRERQAKDPERPAEPRQQAAAPAPAPVPVDYDVFFDRPLEHGAAEIVGKTIMEVATSSPVFPPIEGLPEELWKEQSCSNCHQWTRADLCEQAKFYNREVAARSLQKEHPFGGSFKRNLKIWADGGCR